MAFSDNYYELRRRDWTIKKVYKTVYEDRTEAISSLERNVLGITWWISEGSRGGEKCLGR